MKPPGGIAIEITFAFALVGCWRAAATPPQRPSDPGSARRPTDHEADLPPNIPPTEFEDLRITGGTVVDVDAGTRSQIIADGKNSVSAVFKVCIDEKARIFFVDLWESSGYPMLDDQMYETIQAWRMRPYFFGKRTVGVCSAVLFPYSP